MQQNIGQEIYYNTLEVVKNQSQFNCIQDEVLLDNLLALLLDTQINLSDEQTNKFTVIQALRSGIELVSCFPTMKSVFEILTGSKWTPQKKELAALWDGEIQECKSSDMVLGIQYCEHGFVLVVRNKNVELIESIAGQCKITVSLLSKRMFSISTMANILANLSNNESDAEQQMNWKKGLINPSSMKPILFCQLSLRSDWKARWMTLVTYRLQQVISVINSYIEDKNIPYIQNVNDIFTMSEADFYDLIKDIQ